MSEGLTLGQRLWPYVQIARPDHWFKNVFALPGFVIALVADPLVRTPDVVVPGLVALVGLCLTASSNYVINEWLDAPFDRLHPDKRDRPAARGAVSAPGVIAEWLLLGALGVGLGFAVNLGTGLSLALLWGMGVVYNVRPLRSKETPYLDVLSESVNNPIRLYTGWAAAGTLLVPPLSLLLAYWTLGAFFMAVKRFAEYREIGDPAVAAGYRRSFAYYTEDRLLVSIMVYAAASAMFAGIFLTRYRIELVLAVPLVAVLFGWYLKLGLQPGSPTIKPERLYTEGPFAVYCALVFVICLGLLVVDVPVLAALFTPTLTADGW